MSHTHEGTVIRPSVTDSPSLHVFRLDTASCMQGCTLSFPLAPKCLRPLQETLECFFFLLASQDAARTPAAGKGELTDTLGCTNLSWCAEGLQAMADLSSGATIAKCGWAGCLDPRVPCRELSSDLIALYHAGEQTGFSCLFLK